MSRMGDEMVAELSKLLGNGLDKTAAKKEKEDEKCEECGKEPCKCKEMAKKEKDKAKADKEKEKEKADKAKAKAKKKKKKAEVLAGVVGELVKLADELDAAGAPEASGLVDEALNVLVTNLETETTTDEE